VGNSYLDTLKAIQLFSLETNPRQTRVQPASYTVASLQWRFGVSRLATVVNVLLFIAGVPCLALGVFQMLTGSPGEAGAALTAGLVLLLASTIDRFESLKGWGVEATTRKLDDKIHEADKLLKRIQSLAELTSGALIKLYAGMGRMGVAPTAKESHVLSRSVRMALSEVGTSDVDVRRTLRPWAAIQAFDLAGKLLQPLQGRFNDIRHERRRAAELVERAHGHDSPEYREAHQAVLDVDTFMERFRHLHQWPLEEVPRMLVAMVAEAPGFPSDERLALMATIESWRPELEHLIAHHDFQHPERWYEELKVIL